MLHAINVYTYQQFIINLHVITFSRKSLHDPADIYVEFTLLLCCDKVVFRAPSGKLLCFFSSVDFATCEDALASGSRRMVARIRVGKTKYKYFTEIQLKC